MPLPSCFPPSCPIGQSWAEDRVGSEDFAPLLAWASNKEALCDKIEIASFGNLGNGVRAKEAIEVSTPDCSRARVCMRVHAFANRSFPC